jgi:hypothetical protein
MNQARLRFESRHLQSRPTAKKTVGTILEMTTGQNGLHDPGKVS